MPKSLSTCSVRAFWRGFVRIMNLIQPHSHSLFGFEQRDSMGTGTASDADWVCRRDENNAHLFQIEEGELQVLVYQKSFEQGDSMGTGTTSDADWACRGDEKNVHFLQIEEGELQVWVY